MDINTYYQTLLEYRNILDKKVDKGEMSLERCFFLTDKLNEWYDIAKMNATVQPKPRRKKD